MSIYFYYLPKSNLVKIGYSTNPALRIKSIATGCSEAGYIIREIYGYGSKAEKWLHKRYINLKVKGEWFEFTQEMLTTKIPTQYVDHLEKYAKIYKNTYFPTSKGLVKGSLFRTLPELRSFLKDT